MTLSTRPMSLLAGRRRTSFLPTFSALRIWERASLSGSCSMLFSSSPVFLEAHLFRDVTEALAAHVEAVVPHHAPHLSAAFAAEDRAVQPLLLLDLDHLAHLHELQAEAFFQERLRLFPR